MISQGSSHGQEAAEERQGPHAHSPHSLPTRGCFPFLGVLGTHWSHHTQKQDGFVSPFKVQDGIKHQPQLLSKPQKMLHFLAHVACRRLGSAQGAAVALVTGQSWGLARAARFSQEVPKHR